MKHLLNPLIIVLTLTLTYARNKDVIVGTWSGTDDKGTKKLTFVFSQHNDQLTVKTIWQDLGGQYPDQTFDPIGTVTVKKNKYKFYITDPKITIKTTFKLKEKDGKEYFRVLPSFGGMDKPLRKYMYESYDLYRTSSIPVSTNKLASTNKPSQSSSELKSGGGKKVIVFGYGDSPDAALDDAFRNAVEEGVGVLLQASTMIENDEIIKDKIYTYSKGFISDFKKLGEPVKQDDEWSLQIAAIIVTEQIKQVLTDAGVTVDFAGQSLFAQATSHENRKADEAKYAQAFFDKFDFSRYFSFEIEKYDLEGEGDTRFVMIDVDVRLDPGYYTSIESFMAEIGEKDDSWKLSRKDLNNSINFSENGMPTRSTRGESLKIAFFGKNDIKLNYLNPETVKIFVDNYSMGLKEHPFVIEFINSKEKVIRTETIFWKGKPTVWDGTGRYVYKNRLIHSSEKNQQSALYACLKAIKRQEEIRKDMISMYQNMQSPSANNETIYFLRSPENNYYGKVKLKIKVPLEQLKEITNIRVKHPDKSVWAGHKKAHDTEVSKRKAQNDALFERLGVD